MEKEYRQRLDEIAEIFIGLYFAKNQARILAFLVMEEKGAVSFNRIVQELTLSKASASTALQALIQKGLVAYQSQENRRERIIQVNLYGVVDYISYRMQILQEMRLLFEKMAEHHQADENYSREFQDIALLYDNLDEAVMKILKAFKGKHS